MNFTEKEEVFLTSVKQLGNLKWQVDIINRGRKLIHRKEFKKYKQAIEYRDNFI